MTKIDNQTQTELEAAAFRAMHIGHVQIRAADTAALDRNHEVGGADARLRHAFNGERRFSAMKNGSSHGWILPGDT